MLTEEEVILRKRIFTIERRYSRRCCSTVRSIPGRSQQNDKVIFHNYRSGKEKVKINVKEI